MSSLTTGRLLSLSATGTIGNAFTYSTFKSCGYVKKHSHPTQTNTPAAIEAREAFKAAAWSWRHVFNSNKIRDAWKHFDDWLRNPATSYTSYMSQAVKLQKINPKASFVKNYYWEGTEMTVEMAEVRSGAPSTESGQFEIWVRFKNGCWGLKERQTMIDGKLDIDFAHELKYDSKMKILKDGYNRSGVILLKP